MVPSSMAMAAVPPSGERATDQTGPALPGRTMRSLGEAAADRNRPVNIGGAMLPTMRAPEMAETIMAVTAISALRPPVPPGQGGASPSHGLFGKGLASRSAA